MKSQRKTRFILTIAVVIFSSWILTSCSDKNDDLVIIKDGIHRSELILTEVNGENVEAHGDHFHGLDAGIEGESITISFDENGIATKNGHLHMEADVIYKLQLKAWDYNGIEVQNQFISDKVTADQYKAFIVGGDFILNPNSSTESGAIFQPREQKYADGTAVNGKYETTGILSYFTVGHDNEGPTKKITYILRKLSSGIKAKVERTDWNRNDYNTVFMGENLIELKFEIHVEHGHIH